MHWFSFSLGLCPILGVFLPTFFMNIHSACLTGKCFVHYLLAIVSLVVSVTVCLERLISEMIYYVSIRTINAAYSFINHAQ